MTYLRAHLLAAASLSALLVACSSSSSNAPQGGATCGDGVAAPGETSETCCLDAGCARGVCDRASKACVDPWVLECAGVAEGACSPSKPYVCQGAAPPTYDCAACGCPDGQTCESGVCYSPETLALRRDTRGIRTDLPLDDYFRFMDVMATDKALSLAEANAEIVRRMREDRRRAMLSLGESHGSDDEQAVGIAVIRATLASGLSAQRIGIEGGDQPILDASKLAGLPLTPLPIAGDLTNTAYCKTAEAQIGDKLSDEGIYVQYSGSGHTSQEACYGPEHWVICRPPHTAECVARSGRKAITVMLFDPEPWLTKTDNAILWRAGSRLPDEAAFNAELDATIAAWSAHFGKQKLDPAFDAQAEGRPVNVRFVPAPHAADTFVAFFPRPARKPFLTLAFKAVWSTPDLRAYLLAGGMGPKDCSISWTNTPGAEVYSFFCSNKSGKELTADVDAKFTVVQSSMK